MTRRVLLVNVVPLVLLVATLLYLNQFQNSLLEAEVSALREQARIYAGALGQAAVQPSPSVPEDRAGGAAGRRARHGVGDTTPGGGSTPAVMEADAFTLVPSLARPLLLRLTEPSPSAQAKLFAPDGQVIADSLMDAPATRDDPAKPDRAAPGKAPAGSSSRGAAAPAAETGEPARVSLPDRSFGVVLERIYDRLLSLLPRPRAVQVSTLGPNADPDAQPDVRQQLRVGEADSSETPPFIRRTGDRRLLVTVAEPVAHDGHTVGIIQLTREARGVDRSLFAVRFSILLLFGIALLLTVLLSWYLSLTIARPLLRLAIAAHTMREGVGRTGGVPSRLLSRRDEIGELAEALDGSARELWARMDAIERFAADVSHEIKNPLSSIRSAIETLSRIEDLNQQRRLLAIIHQDVRRLDRLITDISDASRVDAELSRATTEPVEVVPMLSVLAEINQATRKEGDPIMVLDVPGLGERAAEKGQRGLAVQAVEDRLVQVLRNLLGNAASFSPPNGRIVLGAAESGGMIEVSVSDEGPGIPPAKLDSIFDRFYSERPASENFGQHSGLGLSISRQIVDALRGQIRAENRLDPEGRVIGARFVVRLPRAV
ncbi:ATP-binding protein [Rhizosaccharibacter radicis]|uniref:histidine kinase n=1 Tax=Rhizosaccharibacter radicis TaxID=2782605 RepID=A0ABT1VSQ8_9PROT|nr:sensor N-terminal transmembrane domain-containing protein [Acetobacteraceae bacterium KSS12]